MKSQNLQVPRNYITLIWYAYSDFEKKMKRFSRDFIISSPTDMMDALSFARGLSDTIPYSVMITDGIRSNCFRC